MRMGVRSHDPSARPQTGVGLLNGLRRNFYFLLDVRQNRRSNIFLRGFLNNPSVESVAGEHTQLFTEGCPIIFHAGPFSSWIRLFLLLMFSADLELGAECLPSDGLPLLGSGLKGRLVPLGFDLVL